MSLAYPAFYQLNSADTTNVPLLKGYYHPFQMAVLQEYLGIEWNTALYPS